MLHCFTPRLTCLYNVSLTSSQGGFEAETVLLKCWWETWGFFSSAINSGFVSSSNMAVLSCSHLSPSKDSWMCLPEILVHSTGCMCWSKCREGLLTGLLSSLNVMKYLKTKDPTRLCGSTPALFLWLEIHMNGVIFPQECKQAASLMWWLERPHAHDWI